MQLNKTPLLSQFAELGRALDCGDGAAAARCLAEFVAAHQIVHDGYRNLVARILTAVFELEGQSGVERLREAHADLVEFRKLLGGPQADIVRMLVAMNHWHKARFTVLEDDEQITLLLQPCGGGGRLINEGRYYRTSARPYALLPNPTPATFGEPNFPIYCHHCAEISRTMLQAGARGVTMEGWTPDHRFGGCRERIFKRIDAVDPQFYRRLGINPPAQTLTAAPAQRLFSEQELREMSEPLAERMAMAIETGDFVTARALFAETDRGWQHGLMPGYKEFIRKLYRQVGKEFGAQTLRTVFSRSVFDLFSAAQEATASSTDATVWLAFWRCLDGILEVSSSKEVLTLIVRSVVLLDLPQDELFCSDQAALVCTAFNSLANPGVNMQDLDSERFRLTIPLTRETAN